MLFGSNDIYLKKVEAAFPKTTITARGNKVVLQGGPNEIKNIERVINELVAVLQKNNSLTENDVETVLSIEPSGNGEIGDSSSCKRQHHSAYPQWQPHQGQNT